MGTLVIIPFLASSSVADTTTQMVRKDFTSLSKVRSRLNRMRQLMTYLFHHVVSHHPPISAYFYISPANKVQIIGELRPKSKFLGNSVSTNMEGENRIFLMGKPEDGGEY